jgi:Pentapeptide repeats (8 copies)
MNSQMPRASRRVRFEEVTPAHEYAAFFNVSIAPLVAHLGLPIFDGYDDLDDLQLAFLTLPSGETVTLGEYAGMPGTSLYIEVTMQSIPQIIFDSCQQLRVSRQELEWVHPDYQVEFDRFSAEYGEIEGIDRTSTAVLAQSEDREPIDCFYHALEIYTRPKLPEHWAMLQHNLGLAYFDRIKGERRDNLQKSIECFNKSLEIFTQNEFPEKWWINQEDLAKSQRLIKQILVEDILNRPRPYQKLRCADLRGANLSGADLRNADLRGANLNFANLDGTNFGDADPIGFYKGKMYVRVSTEGVYRGGRVSKRKNPNRRLMECVKGANLSDANLSNSNLRSANLRGANLKGANLKGADVRGAKFGFNLGISESMEQDLIDRGAIFDDAPPGDRSESRTLIPR